MPETNSFGTLNVLGEKEEMLTVGLALKREESITNINNIPLKDKKRSQGACICLRRIRFKTGGGKRQVHTEGGHVCDKP